MADDKKLYFGGGKDVSIEYDEDGTDELRFAGNAVTFEQAVSFDGNMTLGLTVADTVTVQGALTASHGIYLTASSYVVDDTELYFGTDKDAAIKYDENASNALIISGAVGGGIGLVGDLDPLYDSAYDIGNSSRSYANLYIDAMGANWTNAGRTIADLGTVSAATSITATDLIGTNIDGILGADTARAATVTTLTANTSVIPDAAGGATLGSTTAEWGDVYIADDKKIQFGNGQDATIEYDEDGTDELRFAGAAVTFEQAVSFDGDMTLGLTVADTVTVPAALTASQGVTLSWDSYLVDDKVLYLGTDKDAGLKYDEAGSNKLIVSGAVGGIGLVGDIDPLYPAVYDLGTSTNKFNAVHITSFGSNWTNASRTVADLGTVTTVDINGGSIDGAVIGANSAAAGTFAAIVGTSLNCSDGNITNVGDIALDSISADGAALSIDSNWDAAGVTCSDLGTVTTVDINGGTADNVVIGGATAAAVTATTAAADSLSLGSGAISGDILLALPSGKDAKARSWITYSERSLKTDIKPMSNALSTILLDGKTTTQAVTTMILIYNQSVLFSTNQSSRSLLWGVIFSL